MSLYQFTNNAETTLGSALSPTATTITVATGAGAKFPTLSAGQFFTATLWASGSTTGVPNEIVKVTARSGDTMTVVRAQEGTTAQQWEVGDTFANYPTAAFYNGLIDLTAIQQQASNYAVDSGTANAGVIALNPAVTSLTALVGVPIRVLKQNAANTGAYTLNVNGLGAKAVNIGGLAFVGKELAGSRIFEVIYNGTTFDLISAPAFINTQQMVNDSVTNAILAAVDAQTIKGNLTDDAAQPYDIPLSELIELLGTITGGAVTAGNTSVHFAMPVTGLPSPLIFQAGKVINGTSNPIFCAFPIEFTTVVLGCGGIPYTNDGSGFSDQDGYIGIAAGGPTLNSLTFAVSRRGGDEHVDGCFWWAIGY